LFTPLDDTNNITEFLECCQVTVNIWQA
jgi:hypothetical protein